MSTSIEEAIEAADWEAHLLAEALGDFAIKRPTDTSAEEVVARLRSWLRAELVALGVHASESK